MNGTRYTYYRNGWLKSVIDNEGHVTSYTYDSNGNELTCVRGNNTALICTYNDANLLLSQTEVRIDTSETISSYEYTYDENGNISQVSGYNTTGTKECISILTNAAFDYDIENRLIRYNGEEITL